MTTNTNIIDIIDVSNLKADVIYELDIEGGGTYIGEFTMDRSMWDANVIELSKVLDRFVRKYYTENDKIPHRAYIEAYLNKTEDFIIIPIS